MNTQPLDDARVITLFTRSGGAYRFARWGQPIAPVIFGTDDATLGSLKDALKNTLKSVGLDMAEPDPALGATLMIFFCQDWIGLDSVPLLKKMLPDIENLQTRLTKAGATQFRSFGFQPDGAIKHCILLLRLDTVMADMPVQTLACTQMTRCLLLWGDTAFSHENPVALVPENGLCVIKPAFVAIIRGAYDQTMPPFADNDSHALRLAARGALILKGMPDAASA